MTTTLPILSGSSGLNTKVDPARLKYDPESGISDLAEAINVFIDDTGRIRRRRGQTATAITDAAHSLFASGDDCLFVSDGDLCRLTAGFASSLVRSNVGDARMYYVEVNDETFYANGITNGVYSNGTSQAWAASEYIGPTTQRVLNAPPVGTHLAYHAGRILIAQDNVVWMTRPFDFYHVDALRGFVMFPSKVLMIRSVMDGFWVGTRRHVHWVSGTNPDEFSQQVKASYAVVEGTDVEVEAELVDGASEPLSTQQGPAAIVTTTKGICYLGQGGRLVNLTRDRLDLPTTITGSAVFKDGEYISCLHP